MTARYKQKIQYLFITACARLGLSQSAHFTVGYRCVASIMEKRDTNLLFFKFSTCIYSCSICSFIPLKFHLENLLYVRIRHGIFHMKYCTVTCITIQKYKAEQIPIL